MIGRTNTGGGGTGATLTVNAPAGATVTVSKGGKTKTKTAGADGVAVFKGLSTGEWTVTITDWEQTAQKSVTITADYSTAITFFSATIHVTYPAGYTCTATDGTTTLTAPDTSGTWDCVVPNAGTWTVTVAERGLTRSVGITTDQQIENVNLCRLYIVHNGVIDDIASIRSNTAASYGDGYIDLTYNGTSGGISTNRAVDISKYATLHINVLHIIKTSKYDPFISVYGVAYSEAPDIYAYVTHVGITSLDISNVTDSRYAYANFIGTIRVKDFWLEV